MTFDSAGVKRKLALDENLFQQLLAAAYVLQKHNESQPTNGHDSGLEHLSDEIAALRSRIVSGGFDLASAAALIADNLRALVHADGVSICLVRDGYLNVVACSGTPARVQGGSLAANSLIATERLRNGHPFQSSDARADMRLDLSLCSELQLASLLAIPIERGGEVAGLVELRWNEAGASKNCDQRICQLMMQLIGEVLDRELGGGTEHVRHSSPSTNASDAAGDSRATIAGPKHVVVHGFPPPDPHALVCRACGHPFASGEEFCINCGAFLSPPTAGGDLQSKWASMWFMQQAQKGMGVQPDEPPICAAEQASASSGENSPDAKPANLPENSVQCDDGMAESALENLKRKSGSAISILKSRLKALLAA